MSLAIDRLSRRGYVVREPDASDRRRVRLRLTPRGARVCESRSVLEPQLVDSLVSHLTDEERVRALDGLHLLAIAAERSAAERRAAPRGEHRTA
jgi:DNA-binding MarR family transcriptional regulator